MAETTISWTHTRAPDGRPVPGYTFNPWLGCTKVSPACDGCYAENLMAIRYKRVEWGAPGKGAGTRVRTSSGNWHQPVRWNRLAAESGTRPFVFCASLADVFDNQVPAEWRRDLFTLMRSTPHLVWLLLTKRPQNIVRLAEAAGGLPPSAALGVTCEDDARWDLNVPALVEAKMELQPLFAFVSAEPLLGPIFARKAPITKALRPWFGQRDEYFDPLHPRQPYWARIDGIFTGGETDQGSHRARPSNPQWFRDLRDDCADTGTAYHHKQNGEWLGWGQQLTDGSTNLLSFGKDPERYLQIGREIVSRVGKHRSGRLLDGIEHNAHPTVPTSDSPEAIAIGRRFRLGSKANCADGGADILTRHTNIAGQES